MSLNLPGFVQNGLRELSNVTNTYGGVLESAGSAYTLNLPWQPHKFEWYRYTAFGTAGTLGSGVWFQGFPDGDDLISRAIADNGVTGNLNNVLETTNGITIANTAGGFQDTHQAITGATAASPCVLTVASTASYSTGDEIFITKVLGMTQLNIPGPYMIRVLTSTTLALYDLFGVPIDSSSFTAYTSGGQINLAGPSLGIVNSAPTFNLLLGSSVMGSASDIIYFQATQFNNYVNLGQV